MSEEVMTPEEQRKADTEFLAARIRKMSGYRRPITEENLAADCQMDVDYANELLSDLVGTEGSEEICAYNGQKHNYYYVYPTLAHNYVRSIALSEEHDIRHTVITLVRYDSKTFPRPTRGEDFGKEPYCYTLIQVKNAVRDLLRDPENADLKVYTSKQGTYYLYSTRYLSEALAVKLAEDSEDMSLWY